MLAGVGGLIEADRSRRTGRRTCGRCGGDHRIEHLRVAGCERDVGLQDRWESHRELLPRRATIGGLEDAVAAAAEALSLDEALLLLPERGVHDVGVLRIDAHIIGARVFVLVQHTLKRRATIERSEDAAFRIRSVRMAERCDEQPVRIFRVDVDHRDHLRFAQSQVRPRFSVVDRLVHAVADRQVRADDAGAAAHVDDVRIGRGDRDRADRAGGLVVEQRHPVGAVVGTAPHAAVVEAGIEHARLRGHAGEGAGPTGAHWPDGTPMERAEALIGLGRQHVGHWEERDGGGEGERVASLQRARDTHGGPEWRERLRDPLNMGLAAVGC